MRSTLRQTLCGFLLALLAGGVAPASAAADTARALAVARAHLSAADLGLGDSDLDDLIVTDTYTTRHNQVTHIYLRQRLHGIEVANGTLTLNLDREGRRLSTGDRLVADLAARANTDRPAFGRKRAIRLAAAGLGLTVVGPLDLLADPGGAARQGLFGPTGLSLDPIPVKLAYYAVPDGDVRLAWEILIRQTDQQHWWKLWLDATSGEILARSDWIDQDTYQALEIPLEDPGEDGLPFDEDRTVIANPADPTASPFGWHDTDGAAGAEFTDTRGNNVNAQEDRNGNNAGGARPSGGAALDFAAAMDLANDQPVDYTEAAVINLFYWNNVLHDVLYGYGFDEPAGNFQENNYGNGGLGTDAVEADAQDGADLVPPNANNANFSTPPDGFPVPPRMQMFEWLPPSSHEVVVASGSAAGTYTAAGAAFGPALDTTGVSGTIVEAFDGTGTTTDACEPITNGAAVNGNLALVDRGICTFVDKVQNAQNAGAVGVIVANNLPGSPITMGGTAFILIPSVMVSQSDGATIRAGTPAPGTIREAPNPPPKRDSDLDNGIIAHEYCHGLSNRLTGGPSTTDCLNGPQQAGEGWSDFCTLFFGAKASDTATTARGVGNYVIFQPPDGPGIRPAPYSTDLAVNPLTYGILTGAPANGISIPHGVGTVWATALWEMYWALVDAHGFDPDLYTGTGGNNVAMQLVVDGMKLQPCDPTFLDARDAILAADLANNAGANECRIWQAFAKRGMGVGADDGGSAVSLAVTEAFDEPAECLNTAPVVAITAPADLAVFDDADSIGFAGTAGDAEDGDIQADLDWTSDLDGAIGTGGSFSTTLTVGLHTVTATVTDSGGLSDQDAIRVIVDDAPGCVADLVVDDPTVTGTNDFDGVNSVTLGPGTTFDGSSVTTVEAGNFVRFQPDVAILGTMAVKNTPTPCP